MIGLSQGIFNLSQQQDGTFQAIRPQIGEGMYDSAGHVVQDHGMLLKLTDMKALVRQTITAAPAK